MSAQVIKTIIGLFILGLSFGSGPCIASCGPVLISYIAGTKKDIIKGLTDYILFSLTRISVYIVLGLLVFFLGRFVMGRFMNAFSKYVLILGGSFIILVGIIMTLGKRLESDNRNIIIMGLVIGFLPCAPLIAILSYIGLISKTWLHSLFYSFSFGIGTFISPLILLVILTGLIPKFILEKKAFYSRVFSFICGLIIIFLGFQLIRRAF